MGMEQGFVMAAWLFSFYVNGVVKELSDRFMGSTATVKTGGRK